jgi:hypothetical protein
MESRSRDIFRLSVVLGFYHCLSKHIWEVHIRKIISLRKLVSDLRPIDILTGEIEVEVTGVVGVSPALWYFRNIASICLTLHKRLCLDWQKLILMYYQSNNLTTLAIGLCPSFLFLYSGLFDWLHLKKIFVFFSSLRISLPDNKVSSSIGKSLLISRIPIRKIFLCTI